ncbi:hypothetical protein A2870_04220 [Candidatus Curtissbacteria bacterium RIFCSPHIGHO2_01_FULL_41_11]|uniref:Uncharacterized protein n=1 Tax=Candidatus Curtissbacteria bacterium RIFCSPHIGHO2_01_FULL_41_11 TaxID=1797711 RepID=A0A1F5G6P6_9BACT|nr:MAG: hypothetical protein A2870_04220 [Candidatus Curtissbacteria bacterium RIFCSPHIGHO2_01_FULL_41_11]
MGERKLSRLDKACRGIVYGGFTVAALGFCSVGVYEMATTDTNPADDPDVLDISKIDERETDDDRGTDKVVIGAGIATILALLATGNKSVKTD